MLAKSLMLSLAAMFVCCGARIAGADEGTIKGVAKWDGRMMKRKPLKTEADPYCAQMYSADPLRSEKLIINDNNTVRDVFVYVKSGLPEGRKWDVPSEPQQLDQSGCHYVPHVFGVMIGQDLLVKNSDNTAHNINCSPKNNDGFNKGQPKKGMQFTVTFSNSEMMVPFKCDVHPWMGSYCAVMDHPFFAVSDEKGQFEIKGLPDGEYVLGTWHEHSRLKAQEMKVSIAGGEMQEVEILFKGPKKK